MKVLITQSNYLPWKGYFRSLMKADSIIFLDDVQYTKRDWRNRNLIKTANGIKWLSIPVITSGKYTQKIQDVIVNDRNWYKSHLNSLFNSYKKTAHFADIYELLENYYEANKSLYLSEINIGLIKLICEYLEIDLNYGMSRDYSMCSDSSRRLLNICESLNADVYMSGQAAKNYINREVFKEANIEIQWIDYSGFEIYSQLYPPFVHEVSIVDTLFMLGPETKAYLK